LVPNRFLKPNLKDFKANVSAKIKQVMFLDKTKKEVYFTNIKELKDQVKKRKEENQTEFEEHIP
tara:strand:+ start:27 stop:218 length:192 start_codon:yes stop_codon:yes gene_type:complete